jgi:hypothetical protein
MFYILYSIIDYKYKEYKINSHIEYIQKLNNTIKQQIQTAQEIIEYKKSKPYKNKILKQDLGFKNKGEKVISLITEDKYNKYTKKTTTQLINENVIDRKKDDITYSMSNYEKWIYFLF